MSGAPALNTNTHVVDILGNVVGRDQPIMILEKASDLVALLSDELFIDDDVVFFDPFCKAGEILLACAMAVCRHRAESNPHLLRVDAIQKEMYQSNRYFALSPDERHHRLSLRTFLGNTNSHNEKYTHIIRNGNYLSEVDGRLNKEAFEKEFVSMINYIKKTSGKKKIVAVGNPPYQESDGGFGKSARNIYNYFAEALIESEAVSEFVLVIPSRWFGGGKGLDGFRETMMASPHLENLRYFNKASDVFPTVDINGGICFLHFNKSYEGPTNFTDEHHEENINFREFDIIPDDPASFSVIRKVQSRWTKPYVGERAWASKPFGLRTNYFDNNASLSKDAPGAIPCLSKGKIIKYVHRDTIERNSNFIDQWKVCAPKAVGGSKGKRRSTVPTNQIFMVERGMITTETYNVIDTFRTRREAENFVAYLRTDFARYMVGLRKITQDLPPDRWNWVPLLDMSRTWTDPELYRFFRITPEEQEHIRTKLEAWA